MIKANYYEVNEVILCPYCMNEVATNPHPGCCGEVHDEVAFEYRGEFYLDDEIETYKPILDTIQYKTRRMVRKIKRYIKGL